MWFSVMDFLAQSMFRIPVHAGNISLPCQHGASLIMSQSKGAFSQCVLCSRQVAKRSPKSACRGASQFKKRIIRKCIACKTWLRLTLGGPANTASGRI